MSSGPTEQRNPYKGKPLRPWVRLRFTAPNGTEQEMELLADTGNPCAVIVSLASMTQLKRTDGPDMQTNFGLLVGGWIRLTMPDFGLDLDVLGYASDVVVAGAQKSSLDFQGLAGLPLLRLVEYGGDNNSFWIRPLSTTP